MIRISAFWGSIRGLIKLKFWLCILGTRSFILDGGDFFFEVIYSQILVDSWLPHIVRSFFFFHCYCCLLSGLLFSRYLPLVVTRKNFVVPLKIIVEILTLIRDFLLLTLRGFFHVKFVVSIYFDYYYYYC